MMRSMTGYGKATCEFPDKRITIEVKSLNSKQLDVFTRVPNMYKEKDIEIRRLIADKLSRGKVEFNLFVESLGETAKSVINKGVLASYLSQIKEVAEATGTLLPEDFFSHILRLPDVMKTEVKELDESEWKCVRASVAEALDHLNTFRDQEGESIYADVSGNIAKIEVLLEQVTPFESERVEKVRQRIKDGIESLEASPNLERIEQEMIFYIEKMDVNEEKIRLAHHCKYFIETAKLDEPVGKKLGFISQEIGREINTLGSKANHESIQKIVVQMKDELEKIKEQVLNAL
jgi:uncharacterized protein (TIGR00255 family)